MTTPFFRCRPDSNRCIEVLQTCPLPLGYGTDATVKIAEKPPKCNPVSCDPLDTPVPLCIRHNHAYGILLYSFGLIRFRNELTGMDFLGTIQKES